MISTIRIEIKREKLNNQQLSPDRTLFVSQNYILEEQSGFLDQAVELLVLINKYLENKQ